MRGVLVSTEARADPGNAFIERVHRSVERNVPGREVAEHGALHPSTPFHDYLAR